MSEVILIEPDWQELILCEIADEKMTRNTVAITYRIIMDKHDSQTDWRKINTAIIERWSKSALVFIKQQAHSGRCWAGIREAEPCQQL